MANTDGTTKPEIHIGEPGDSPEAIFQQILDQINLTFGEMPRDALDAALGRADSRAVMLGAVSEAGFNNSITGYYGWGLKGDIRFAKILSGIRVQERCAGLKEVSNG